MKQTILGAGGAVGIEVARALTAYTHDIRLVGRNPKKVNASDEVFKADLTNRDQVFHAVAGSGIVYLTLGFEYSTRVWKTQWPALIRNVIDACLEHQAKLVFFDNAYAIGGNHVNHITEDTPFRPSSQKGQVRAEVDEMLLQSIAKHHLQALIARAPDIFGDIKVNSILMHLVYDNLVRGEKAVWLCNADLVHSIGYTPELAKGTVMLGNTADAYNQIWNLPVDQQRITGKEWIQLFAQALDKNDAFDVLPAALVKELGVDNQIMHELFEMLYQYDRDYFFDSSKFNQRFNYTPISHAQAVQETVRRLA
ncbi:NAD(P)H-binding protein [Chitinophaga varians]|uniref:NAD(P)H-binding protein n=1 Tax=Chitinophaga varians TaxID=2202339 RepID=A0A847S0X6_9BACT|nr:NAD-dependent epimerase/dehydratase family protein [Chitinophaga varians]NLR66768.1 NAD(P)H-binding protein [Chitinophaga varians]